MTEATAAWPKAAPEVLFFHMSQLSMPEYALGQYFKQFGDVKYVVVHPNDGRCAPEQTFHEIPAVVLA